MPYGRLCCFLICAQNFANKYTQDSRGGAIILESTDIKEAKWINGLEDLRLRQV